MRSQGVALSKALLTAAGRRLSEPMVARVRTASGYLAVGRWVSSHGWDKAPRVASRNAVFDAMIGETVGEPIAYLEFGVYEGRSIRRWVEKVSHPQAEFHGFDSFEGLPETFDAAYPRGHFDVKGQTPNIDDARVHWHVGWFEETLPSFKPPTDKRLVVTLDADLYSATKFVLNHLNDHMKPGTLVYFDELSRVDHEPAAFDDFCSATGKTFEPLAFEKTLNTGAFILR